MNNGILAGILLIMAIASPRMGNAAVVGDTLNGIVTDSLDSPLDGVHVESEGVSARTKGDGTFQLVFSTTTRIGPIKPMGQEQRVLWNPERSAFSWPKADGDISIRIQDILGRTAAQYSSPQGSEGGEFSVAKLPHGNLIASIRIQNRTEADNRLIHLSGLAGSGQGAFSRASGAGSTLLAKAAATVRPYGVTFTMPGYKSDTVMVASGHANGSIVKVRLSSTGEAKSAYALTHVELEPEVTSLIESKWKGAFVHVTYPTQWLGNVQTVNPGGSIQAAINAANAAGGGVVLLKAGTHIITGSITLKSKVTLTGEGRARTILKQGPGMGGNAFGANGTEANDVVIKDLTLDGTRAGGANGIYLAGNTNRIMLQNITLTNWGGMGVHMKRINNIIMDNCVFQYNGAANGLFHNVYFLHNQNILQSDCDMSNPILGKGNKYTSCKYVIAQRCVIRNCSGNGIQADNTEASYILFHKYTVSGCGRVALWFPCENFSSKYTYTENPAYAPQNVILSRCTIVDNTWGAMWRLVGNSFVINSTFANQKIDMGLLKCGVTMENSAFAKGNQIYTDVKQWPSDVQILW